MFEEPIERRCLRSNNRINHGRRNFLPTRTHVLGEERTLPRGARPDFESTLTAHNLFGGVLLESKSVAQTDGKLDNLNDLKRLEIELRQCGRC
ncbi:hypothetical protein CEXT_109531 [Caerostris extrusa]|uniref:Uncharacterized protein n=1 Tax=Caerostris extrusa TaxID=172846 RepID=A0AAV4WS58_CAEEX|nr:hypothetical protein CEXT_109531 [Caerostris extrusa]